MKTTATTFSPHIFKSQITVNFCPSQQHRRIFPRDNEKKRQISSRILRIKICPFVELNRALIDRSIHTPLIINRVLIKKRGFRSYLRNRNRYRNYLELQSTIETTIGTIERFQALIQAYNILQKHKITNILYSLFGIFQRAWHFLRSLSLENNV